MKILLAALLALIHSNLLQAEVVVRGYGTVGYSAMIKKDVKDPAEDFEYFGETGYQGTINRDTRFGLNISSEIGENMEAITQFGGSFGSLFHGFSITNRIDLEAQLLLVRYQLNDEIKLLFGLQPAPLWLISEEINISYTYPWARPPNEIYFAADATDLRGLTAIYEKEFDDFAFKSTLSLGELGYDQNPYGRNLIVYVRHFNGALASAALTLFDNTVIRGVVGAGNKFKTTYDTQETFNATRPTGEEGTFRASELATIIVEETKFSAGGFRSEIDDLYIMGEIAQRALKFGDGTGTRGQGLSHGKYIVDGHYLTLGYNFGDWTPRVTYAFNRARLIKDRTQSSLSESIPVDELKEVAEYQGTVIAQSRSNGDQETMYYGLDYSWSPILTQKFELEHIKTSDEHSGLSEIPKATELQVFTTTLAYVF